ncbi:MAG: LPP20 family lipoprotein, partial [Tenuifilum sp.]|uniref:LPP20 family lipoprotein n=1 Tax=Tenuifilum sp. TaxID=2760880 RepID=UPI003CAC7E8B
GIGSARKTTPDYQQAAKQSALADLASDISVSISSQSVLNAFESQNYFSEDFRSSIRAEAQKELEGYEVVDSWEDQNTYWIYYRLSKDNYRRMVEEKKAAAAAKSLDFYAKAITAIEGNDSRTALLILVKALEPIKPFFAETITATYRDKQIFLGNEIISTLTSTLNSLTLKGPKAVNVKLGFGIESDKLTYLVTSSNGIPQKSIPLKITYTERPLTNNRIITNNQGEASFSINAVRSRKLTETITVGIDFESIVKEATHDFAIGKILARFKTPSTETQVIINRPRFLVTSNETNLGVAIERKPLAESLKRKILEAGFPITENPAEADYNININSSTRQTGQSGQYTQVSLNLQITVTNTNGNTVYTHSTDRINASHFEAQSAGINAYTNAAKRIESYIAEELIERIIKGDRTY